MSQEIAVKSKPGKNKWDDETLVSMYGNTDTQKLLELYPAYDNSDIANDLLELARMCKGTEKEDDASRMASTILIRALPLVVKQMEAKKKWIGSAWFDGAVVAAGFAALIYLLSLVGVVQWVGV